MEQNKFYQIKNVTEHEYTLVGCDGSVITRPIRDIDKTATAFTIQDAKPGDVLKNNELTIIFRKRGNERWDDVIDYYAFMSNNSNKIKIQEGVSHAGCYSESDYVPATKEQRDLLFQKMKKAGYEWDAEKKELKLLITNGGDFESENCEQKPVKWSEEDETGWTNTMIMIKECAAHTYTKDSIKVVVDWLKSLKERIGG